MFKSLSVELHHIPCFLRAYACHTSLKRVSSYLEHSLLKHTLWSFCLQTSLCLTWPLSPRRDILSCDAGKQSDVTAAAAQFVAEQTAANPAQAAVGPAVSEAMAVANQAALLRNDSAHATATGTNSQSQVKQDVAEPVPCLLYAGSAQIDAIVAIYRQILCWLPQ